MTLPGQCLGFWILGRNREARNKGTVNHSRCIHSEAAKDDVLPKVQFQKYKAFAPTRVGLGVHIAVSAALPLSELPAPILSFPLFKLLVTRYGVIDILCGWQCSFQSPDQGSDRRIPVRGEIASSVANPHCLAV